MSDEPLNSRAVWRLRITVPAELAEELSAHLFEAEPLGIEEKAGELILYPEQEEKLHRFEQIVDEFRVMHPHWHEEIAHFCESITQDWDAVWIDQLGPEKIGNRFVLRPTHCAPAPIDEQTLWYKPEVSFGSGQHATTRLAASFIEEYMITHPSASCLDVGTGSGVLSLIAAVSGAANCLAVDCDPVAVKSADVNVKLNQLEGRVRVALGSANASNELFDLVVANINTPVLVTLVSALRARLKKSGTLVLTGLLEEDEPEISSLYQALDLRKKISQKMDGWMLLSFEITGS